MEGTIFGVDVGLVHFIGEKDEVFRFAEMDDIFHVLLVETAASGIAGIYHDEGAGVCSFGASLLKSLAEIGNGERPVVFLGQVVRDWDAFE
jgi:hypothetical protein